MSRQTFHYRIVHLTHDPILPWSRESLLGKEKLSRKFSAVAVHSMDTMDDVVSKFKATYMALTVEMCTWDLRTCLLLIANHQMDACDGIYTKVDCKYMELDWIGSL